jgi:Na+-driven multidrug efflux pump
MHISDSKRIFQNTIFLYIRMFFILGVNLYTSRVIIKLLGFDDYGLYSILGGIVSLVAFLHGALSGSTTRFLNFELGKKNYENMKKVFNSSVIIHISFVLLIVFFAEVVGMWLIYNKLSIVPSRMYAALIVFQISVITVAVNFLQIPYDAVLIARQKMSVFASISVLESILKLVIVFVVGFLPYDKLIAYAVLLLIVTVIVRLICQFYCVRNFEECKFSLHYDKDIGHKILSFFGWDLYGGLSVTLKDQGVNILQNMFHGTVINVSTSISNQVSGAFSSFSQNVLLAIKPQIYLLYAEKKYKEMLSLTFSGTRISFLLFALVSIPFIVYTDFLLNLWLVKVPDFANVFCKLILITNSITLSFTILIFIIHASGDIKRLGFVGGTVLMSSLPISYFFFLNGSGPVIPYIVNIVTAVLWGVNNMIIVKKLVPEFNLKNFVFQLILPFVVFWGTIFLYYFLVVSQTDDLYDIILKVSIGSLLSISLGYFLIFTVQERNLVKSYFNKNFIK